MVEGPEVRDTPEDGIKEFLRNKTQFDLSCHYVYLLSSTTHKREISSDHVAFSHQNKYFKGLSGQIRNARKCIVEHVFISI